MRCYAFSALISLAVLTVASQASGVLTSPNSQQAFSYASTSEPVVSSDPSLARPIGVGTAAEGGGTLSLRVALDAPSSPLDIFVALYVPILDPANLFLFTASGSLQPASLGVVPWKAGSSSAIDDALLPDIPVSVLPPGTYYAYFLATPAGNTDSHYLWITEFFVGGWTIQEIEAALTNTLGVDDGFAATFLALDEGYSLRQLAEAAVTGRLDAFGVVQSMFGGIEPPAMEPAGIFDALDGLFPETRQTRLRTLEELEAALKTIERIKGKAIEAGHEVGYGHLALIYALLQEGWRPQRIAEILMTHSVDYEFVVVRNRVVARRISDGSTVDPDGPAQNVLDLDKSVSDLKATLTGPASLGTGAPGSWTATVTHGVGPYGYTFYWGGGKQSDFVGVSSPSQTASHTYEDEGTYEVRVRVIDEGRETQANTNVSAVEVRRETAALPFTRCTVEIWLDNATVEHLDHWGLQETLTGYDVDFDFHAVGTFGGAKFTGTPDRVYERESCTGTMTIELEEPSSDSLSYWVERFSASFSCPPYETKAVQGGGVELWEYDYPDYQVIQGAFFDDAACSAIDFDSVTWEADAYYNGEWLSSMEYLSHLCGSDTVQISCTNKSD
jgi:PKD repeat protein